MSTAKFDTLSNLAGTASVPTNTVVSGSAKAWVNFNGTGTVAIRASFNVSSITDNGTGDYTVNFTNAMADANYGVVCTGSATGVSSIIVCRYSVAQATAPTTSAIRVGASNGNTGVATDDPNYYVAIFR